jgi:hypothetical protein
MSEVLPWLPYPVPTSVSGRYRREAKGPLFRRSAAAASSREIYSPVALAGGALVPLWGAYVRRRVDELSQLPENWDSYGGLPLQEIAAAVLDQLLEEHADVIQSAPSISLSGVGGLVCIWQTNEFHVELLVDPDEEPGIYFRHSTTRDEWEGPVSRCPALDKWLWQASYSA